MAYCTQADVVAFLPSGGLPNPARVATALATSNEFTSDEHGMSAGATVRFRAEVDGELPTGISANTTYYVLEVSSSRFKVSATSGGAEINFTTDGENFVFTAELPWSQWIAWGERQVDSFLPSHVVPMVAPFPEMVVTATAELAAMRGLQSTGGADIDLGARIDAIGVRLTRWSKGLPIRGVDREIEKPVNLAITASAGATDPRGWAGNGNEVLP